MSAAEVDVFGTTESLWVPDKDINFWTYRSDKDETHIFHYHVTVGNRAGWIETKCPHQGESGRSLGQGHGEEATYLPAFQIRDMLDKFRNPTPEEQRTWNGWDFSETYPV